MSKQASDSVYSSIYPKTLNSSSNEITLSYDEDTKIKSARGKFYMLDLSKPNEMYFSFQCEADITISHLEHSNSDYAYLLSVSQDDSPLLVQEIATEMQYEYYHSSHSIVWVLPDPFSTWSFVFSDQKEEKEFHTTMTQCLFETNTQQEFAKLKVDDRTMLQNSITTDLDMDIDEEEYPETEDYYNYRESSDEEDESEEEDEESDEEEEEKTYFSPQKKKSDDDITKYKNSELVDSYKHLRSFVVRGPNIGVFKREDEPVYENMINSIQTLDGKKFTPTKVMLHDHDNNLLCLAPSQKDKMGTVFRMDLTRGEIVDEWSALGDIVPVNAMTPLDKYAQQTSEQVFGVLNTNTLFGFDPRLPRDKVVGDINSLSYSVSNNPRFSCLATAGDGSLAVGSERGEVRLYSGVPGLPKVTSSGNNPKTAKTLLPGLGDPIKGIDVSVDGKWVLATCKNYLMLIHTEIPDSSKTGFTTKMSADTKPKPRILKLNPQDLKLVGKVDFTTARFNTGCDGELWIVSSTGSYVITWNFRRVRRGQLDAYTMKKEQDETVVLNQFASVARDQPGRDAPIIVTTPDNLFLEHMEKSKTNPFQGRRSTYSSS